MRSNEAAVRGTVEITPKMWRLAREVRLHGYAGESCFDHGR